ncbi:MAG: transcription termination/antitermination protein NusG [Verrucomicrobiota bacterium]
MAAKPVDSRTLTPSQTADVTIASEPGRYWTAVHTKPRCEKVVLQHCWTHQIPVYLPLRRRAKRYQRRNVVTYLPMFPGYIFVQLDPERKNLLVRSNRVVHILPVDEPAEEQLVRELNALRELELTSAETEVVVQPEIAEGRTVRIAGGPMKGVTGIVSRRRDKIRVTVNIELLGQSASAEVDVGDLEIEE